jgi:predicted ribosomally synthesized peptide with SipW-like signal peptide
MIIAAAAIITTGAGTFAYFSDNGTSNANTFTSGTLDVQLSNDGVGGWSNDVSATWVSPAGWAPGNSFVDSLTFRNVGTVAAHSGLIDFQNGGCDGPNMFEKIQVTSYAESFDGGTTYIENISGLVSVFGGVVPDGKLSLWELINGDTTTPGTQSPSPYDLAIYTPHPTLGDQGAWGNGGSSAGELDVLPFGNPDILPANQGQVYIMKMEFKFMEEAGNAYQGVTCTMNINTKFVQIPGVRPWTDITLSDGNPTGY